MKLVVALGLLLFAYISPSVAQHNIILILTDDQRADEWQYMPKLNALIASQGASIPNFLISTSLCCPSRATFLTGRYAHNTGVKSNKPGWTSFQPLEGSSVAAWLANAGYRTGMFGKYFNGYSGTAIPPGWSEWAATYSGGYFDYTMNRNGSLIQFGHQDADYQPTVLTDTVINFINSSTTASRPFFAYVVPNSAHGSDTNNDDDEDTFPLYPSQYAALFANEIVSQNPSFNEADVSDKPSVISGLPALTATQVETLNTDRRARLRSLMAVDEMIGRIVDALISANQLQNTYIFVTSDNGFLLGEHRIAMKKNLPYEEAVRVSAFVRGPGIPANTIVQDLIGNVDLASTFAQIAGITPPSAVDGRRFLNTLKGTGQTSRKAYLLQNWYLNNTTVPRMAGFRTATLKYVEHDTGERELYDLVADPWELNNLAPSMPTGVYSEYLSQLKTCSGQQCRDLENNSP